MKTGELITIVWNNTVSAKARTLEGTLDDITPNRMIIVKKDKEIFIPLTSIQYAYQNIDGK